MATYAVSRELGVFSVFLLLLIPWGWCGSNSCDVDHCSHLLHAVYKDFLLKGTQRFCRNPTEVIKCVEDCFEIFFPDSFNIDYGTSIFNEMCLYDMKYDLNVHWDCISRHFHRLLSCVSISESMTAGNTTKDASRHLACKKVLKILDCPLKILQDCEEEAVETVTRLFSLGLKSLMQSSCFQIPLDVAVDMPVHYSLDNNYINVATCLDNEPNLASNCFKHYLQKAANYDLNNCSSADGKCVKRHGVTCSPLFPINDFYIPIFSFGQHICKEAPDDYNPQVPHPLTSVNNNAEKEPGTQVYDKEKSTVPPTNTSHKLSSDVATWSDMPSSDQDLLLSDSNTNTKESNLNVITTLISSDPYHSNTSMSPFNNGREFIVDIPNSNVSQHVVESNSACGAMLYSSYLIFWLITGHIFL